MCGLLGLTGGLFAAKKAADAMKPDIPKAETPATPAVSAPNPDVRQETGVDAIGKAIKRKAKGKKGLMIQPTNTTGGGSVGGTGLNI